MGDRAERYFGDLNRPVNPLHLLPAKVIAFTELKKG